MARTLIAVPVFILLAALAGLAQTDTAGIRTRLEKRFEVLPLADGVVLTPRFKTSIRSIQIAGDTIAIDGTPMTGGELRERLGSDLETVLQISYLDAPSRRALAGIETVPPVKPAEPVAPTIHPEPPRSSNDGRPIRSRRSDALVRIGGSVDVAADELIEDDVVVIGGTATVNGQVEGDLVVVGGSARLGPTANIHGDVNVVGGRLDKDPGAVIGGEVHEVGFGGVATGPGWMRRSGRSGWSPMDAVYPFARFMGTLARIGLLMLFAALVMFVAKAPVEQIAERAAAEPVKAWAIGFLAEILFVPVLVLTVFVLAVSLIGIPLLLLVPVAIVAGIVAFLVGFTGVAYHVGSLLQARFDQLRARPYAAMLAGILVIVSPLLLARIIGLAGGLGVVGGLLVGTGIVFEYLAWTTGLGAAALVRFGGPLRPSPEALPPAPSVTSA